MQVDLENLEPGSVVETPEVCREYYIAPRSMYIGTMHGKPKFAVFRDGTWFTRLWPGTDTYRNIPPVPDSFELIEDKALIKSFVDAYRRPGGFRPGEIYSSGCDPEIFVTDYRDKVIPARTVLGEKYRNSPMFYDGIQAEFCPSPGGCLEGLGSRIRNLLKSLRENFTRMYPYSKLSIKNSILLTQEEMAKLDDEDVMFRCSDSLNVYDDVPGIQEPRKYLWRFAGGHIHAGPGRGKPMPVLRSMVRAMDGIVGVAGVSLARNFDTPERRRNYGRAGEFRLPEHGLEYRVLSNFWLCSPLIYHLTFELARWGYQLGESGLFQAAWEGSEEETRECINNCDVPLAEKIIKRNAHIYDKLFQERWGQQLNPTLLISKAMDTIMNGLEVVVKDPADIDGNWYLDAAQDIWGSYGDVPNGKWRNLRCS